MKKTHRQVVAQLEDCYNPLSKETARFYDVVHTNCTGIGQSAYYSGGNLLTGREGASQTGVSRPKDGLVIRIDIPVWFNWVKEGAPRVIIYGREPRDTNSRLDVHCDGASVLATPFACDRWQEPGEGNSVLSGGMRRKYYDVFKDLIAPHSGVFVLISDIYKKYRSGESMPENDEGALQVFRSMFVKKAAPVDKHELEEMNQACTLIRRELEIIQPNLVICLGNDVFEAFDNDRNGLIDKANEYGCIRRVRHPSRGGQTECRLALATLKKQLVARQFSKD